ncbi:hypothetical protein IWX87_002035 [Polaromonas sp. CG_9.7]|uniref:hypothetical protein n=1 Tax=Polaromonas sp. CG_23.6 TaxID=2760709 RepID=UPI001A1A46A6|nr:hypothetical protein [Polaromonas sp. CG_9.7]MBG6114295.1 hypothetical protein [Polaromonas sp. CG_9.2]MDH6182746.1 hypothetical protein [Polaromonas sp. CG_23.6]
MVGRQAIVAASACSTTAVSAQPARAHLQSSAMPAAPVASSAKLHHQKQARWRRRVAQGFNGNARAGQRIFALFAKILSFPATKAATPLGRRTLGQKSWTSAFVEMTASFPVRVKPL